MDVPLNRRAVRPVLKHDFHIPARPSLAPWTASRCNRLLRQMTSFVKRLEKWHDDYVDLYSDNGDDDGTGGSHDGSHNNTNDAEVANDKLTQDEPDWLGTKCLKNKRKLPKTYASRRKTVPRTPARGKPAWTKTQQSPDRYDTLPPLLIPRTPASALQDDDPNGGYTARKSHIVIREVDEHESNRHIKGRDDRDTRLRLDQKQIIREGRKIIPSFLIATSDPDLPSRWKGSRTRSTVSRETGAQSLLSMCLKKLSQNLLEEQAEVDAVNDGFNGQSDIVGAGLDDLEDFFGNTNSGWPSLRIVTRACGIQMMRNLVKDGLLPASSALEMAINSFSNPLLADFGEAITDTLIDLDMECRHTPSEMQELMCMKAISAYRFDRRDRWRREIRARWLMKILNKVHDPSVFMTHHLDSRVLIEALTGSLHDGQISSRNMIQAIYSRALGPDATDFIHSLRQLPTEDGRPVADAVTTLVPHPLAGPVHSTLGTAIGLILSNVGQDATRISKEICYKVQLAVEIHGDELSQRHRMLTAQIFLATLLRHITSPLQVVDEQDMTRIQTSFELLLSQGSAPAGLRAHLVLTLLRQRLKREPFMQMVNGILSIDCVDCPKLRVLLAKVCADAAMDYARTMDQDDLTRQWALQTHGEAGNREQDAARGDSGGLIASAPAYKWDEIVEEWIAKTPAKTPKKPTIPSLGADKIQDKGWHGCDIVVNHGSTSKRVRAEFEICSDGDFVYKKSKRKALADDGHVDSKLATALQRTTVLGNRRKRRVFKEDDTSDDELSLIE